MEIWSIWSAVDNNVTLLSHENLEITLKSWDFFSLLSTFYSECLIESQIASFKAVNERRKEVVNKIIIFHIFLIA